MSQPFTFTGTKSEPPVQAHLPDALDLYPGWNSTREFDTGATRDQDTAKFDYEGFMSPLALVRFATYMHAHRFQSDGTLRDSDNWQKGIPRSSYMKSMWRHLVTVWRWHRRAVPVSEAIACESMEEALCGVIFNAQGYLHEVMKAKEECLLQTESPIGSNCSQVTR